ncbi:MAG: peptidoglycan editing factor PgeF [bacterium]
MRILELMGFLQFDNLKHARISHGISIRSTYVNRPSNHLSIMEFKAGDTHQNLARNQVAIGSYFRVEPDKFYLLRQVHSSDVLTVSDQSPEEIASTPADALVTQQPGCLLGVLVADCYPVLASDRSGHIVAAIHAGRLGIQNGILQNTISAMCRQARINASDILVGVGPGICRDHYPVDRKTADLFIRETDKYYQHHYDEEAREIKLDLRSTLHAVLVHQGIPSSQIEHLHYCTYQNPDMFFSHRYSEGQTGRFGAFIRRADPDF